MSRFPKVVYIFFVQFEISNKFFWNEDKKKDRSLQKQNRTKQLIVEFLTVLTANTG